MKNEKQQSLGFTLIELLVVIAIIGIISGVVVQALGSARTKSREATRLASIDQLQKALEVAATTSGTNSLPSTTPYSPGYICLGLTPDSVPSCWPAGTPTNNGSINTTLTSGLAGAIPRDPKFQNGIGTAYLYNSNVAPAGLTNGAYLSWVTEGTSCGRGVNSSPVTTVTNGTQCFLRIGNAI